MLGLIHRKILTSTDHWACAECLAQGRRFISITLSILHSEIYMYYGERTAHDQRSPYYLAFFYVLRRSPASKIASDYALAIARQALVWHRLQIITDCQNAAPNVRVTLWRAELPLAALRYQRTFSNLLENCGGEVGKRCSDSITQKWSNRFSWNQVCVANFFSETCILILIIIL